MWCHARMLAVATPLPQVEFSPCKTDTRSRSFGLPTCGLIVARCSAGKTRVTMPFISRTTTCGVSHFWKSLDENHAAASIAPHRGEKGLSFHESFRPPHYLGNTEAKPLHEPASRPHVDQAETCRSHLRRDQNRLSRHDHRLPIGTRTSPRSRPVVKIIAEPVVNRKVTGLCIPLDTVTSRIF